MIDNIIFTAVCVVSVGINLLIMFKIKFHADKYASERSYNEAFAKVWLEEFRKTADKTFKEKTKDATA